MILLLRAFDLAHSSMSFTDDKAAKLLACIFLYCLGVAKNNICQALNILRTAMNQGAGHNVASNTMSREAQGRLHIVVDSFPHNMLLYCCPILKNVLDDEIAISMPHQLRCRMKYLV